MFTRRGTVQYVRRYTSRKSPSDRLDRSPCRYGAGISLGKRNSLHAKVPCLVDTYTVLLPYLGWVRLDRQRIYDADAAPRYAFYAIVCDLKNKNTLRIRMSGVEDEKKKIKKPKSPE